MSVTGRSLDSGTKDSSWEVLDHPVPMKQTHSSPDVNDEANELTKTYTKTKHDKLEKGECYKDSEATNGVSSSQSCYKYGVSEKQEFDISTRVLTPRTPSDYTSSSSRGSGDQRSTRGSGSPLSRHSVRNMAQRELDIATYIDTQPDKVHEIDAVVEEFEAFARKSKATTRHPDDDIEENDEIVDDVDELLEGTTADVSDNNHPRLPMLKNHDRDIQNRSQIRKDAEDSRRSYTRDETFTQDSSMLEARNTPGQQGKSAKPW